MPKVQKLQMLLAMLGSVLLIQSPTASAADINFAIVWDNEGIAAIAQNLFDRIFLPQLTNSCLAVPGFNDTRFRFFEVIQQRLYDLQLANQQISNLTRDKVLFIGGQSRAELNQLRTAGITSGVPTFSEFAQIHEFAPLPVTLVSRGIYSAMSVAFGVSSVADRSIAIILGAGYELSDLRGILESYTGNFYSFNVNSGSEAAVLQQVRGTGATNLLLMAPAQIAENFLTAAFRSRMLEPTYRWFFYNSRLVDKNNFEGFRVISKNITSMEFGPIATAIANNLTLAREIYLYDLLSIWVKYLRKIVCNETGQVNERYTGMTGAFRLLPNGSVTREDWTMNFYRGLGDQRERIGNWSSSGMFHFTAPTIRVPTNDLLKQELKLNRFRVVTILQPPYVQYKKGFENRTDLPLYDKLEGLAIDICKQILQNLTLTNIEFFLQPDGQFGALDSTGQNWNGVVQTLIQGQADIACVTLSPTEKRSQVIQFTDPFLSYQLSILFKKKLINPLNNMFQFLQPFHLYSWIGVIGSVIVLAVVLSVLHQLSRNSVSFSLYDSIFFSFASLIQGITGTPPDRPSGQLVIAVYWLFAFVVLVAYVTNYAALRTLDRLQSDISSIESLLSQSAYEYGTVSSSSYLALFENSTIVARQQVYRHLTEEPERRLPGNLTSALRLVSNASYAFIYEDPLNTYYSQLICEAVSVGRFGSDTATLGIPISAEYRDLVSGIINSIISSGQRDALYNKYFTVGAADRPDCTSKTFPNILREYIPTEQAFFNTKTGALTLNNTLGIAVINLVGSILTLLLAVVEWFVGRCLRWRTERKERQQNEVESVAMSNGGRGESSA